MNQESQEWYIAERSRALAMVHLTRRDDLVVLKPVPGIGLEFIVCISKENGEPSVRQFGVIVGGRKNAVTETQLDRMLRPTMQAFVRKGPFPYPVCLFHFSMDEDLAHYM